MPKLKERADGRLCKTMTDPRTEKRIFFYGQSEREINKKIMEYNMRIERGRGFREISEEWWSEAEPKLAIQSIRTYNAARLRAEDEFGNMPIRNILSKDISGFLNKLSHQSYSQKTISNQRLVINRIMHHAVISNDIQYNPCADVEIPKGLPKTTRSAASKSDEEKVKESADVWLFPFMALMTGMRKGEILALQWQDIDFENNFIRVTKSVYHDGDKPFVKAPKTEAGNRLVPLLTPLKEELLKVKNRQPAEYIISNDGKTPMTNKRFTTLYNKFKELTGVSCTAHQLRHSFATVAFECGVPVKSVQEILGHKQISTTMDLYTDFRKESLNAAANLLNTKIV